MFLNDYLSQAKNVSEISAKSSEWLDMHKDIRIELDDIRRGLNQLQFAIPIFAETTEKGAFGIHPWHHLLFEADQDLDSAFLLLAMGFYKDSFRAMRSFLELTFFALSNFVNEDQIHFDKWLLGKSHTPKFEDLIRNLQKKDNFKKLNNEVNWKANVSALYSELSGYIHTRGAEHTNSSLRVSNILTFSETGISECARLLIKTMELAAESFVMVFPMSLQPLPLIQKFGFSPPAGGFLDEGQVAEVRGIFKEPILTILIKVCCSDPEAASLTEWVRSSPDMSDEEIADGLKRTLDSKEFTNSKEAILNLLKEGKVEHAIAYVNAVQRAMILSLNFMLFNPFLSASTKTDSNTSERE